MTRTLSVAGTLAALLLAFWIQHPFGGKLLETTTRALPATNRAVAQGASLDATLLAMDDLAACPMAAGR